MDQQARFFADIDAGQHVLQALGALDAKEAHQPLTDGEIAAEKQLFLASVHVREVSFRWDFKAKNLVKSAHAILSQEYGTRTGEAALCHCESALKLFSPEPLWTRVTDHYRQRKITRNPHSAWSPEQLEAYYQAVHSSEMRARPRDRSDNERT